ncbi:MAG: cobalamin-binding protein [Arenicellales bacterium]
MKKFVSVEYLAATFRVLAIYLIIIGSSANAAVPGVRVIDDFDRVVTLPAPAQRIISLAPHNTENLFSAGAGNRVVGVVEYSDYPPEAKHIPSVGSHVQFNLEAIIALEPDLVVAWRSGNNRDALKQIEQLGIPVYYSEPRSFESIVENIQELAALSGTTELQDPDLSRIQQNIESARAEFAHQKHLDVFYQVWTDPLMTLNGDHLISRVLEVCGARHLFAELSIIAPRISFEAVVDANPDVIVTGMVNNQKPDMAVWEKWYTVKAVKNQHFIYVDSDVMHRHTLRMLKGVQSFCHQLDKVRRALH